VVERLAFSPIFREVALFPPHRPLFGAVEENLDAFVVVARVAIDTAHPTFADEEAVVEGEGRFFFMEKSEHDAYLIGKNVVATENTWKAVALQRFFGAEAGCCGRRWRG
jgi:hypothetical protein